jgi:hypothetical protein
MAGCKGHIFTVSWRGERRSVIRSIEADIYIYRIIYETYNILNFTNILNMIWAVLASCFYRDIFVLVKVDTSIARCKQFSKTLGNNVSPTCKIR